MVGRVVLPNYPTQSSSGTDYPLAIDDFAVVTSREAHRFAVSATEPIADLSIQIAAGHIWTGNGLSLEVAAQSFGPIAAPTGNPRRDIIHIDGDGVPTRTEGVEAAAPVDPAIADGLEPLARLNWTVGMTEITNAVIDDLRPGAGGGRGKAPLFEPLQTVIGAGQSSIILDGGTWSDWKELVALAHNVDMSIQSTISLHVREGGITQTDNNCENHFRAYTGAVDASNFTTIPSFVMHEGVIAIGALYWNRFSCVITNPASTTNPKVFTGTGHVRINPGPLQRVEFGGLYGRAQAIDGIEFKAGAGTIDGGVFTLAGVAEA